MEGIINRVKVRLTHPATGCEVGVSDQYQDVTLDQPVGVQAVEGRNRTWGHPVTEAGGLVIQGAVDDLQPPQCGACSQPLFKSGVTDMDGVEIYKRLP